MKKIADLRLLISDWGSRRGRFRGLKALGEAPISTRKSTIRNSQRGVALISVLAMLVLLSILIVGFLIRAGSENVASGNYRAVSTTRILADTAVNLVQAVINEATTPESGTAWASQPGAIRLFDETGGLTKVYRLYSAASLVADTNDASILASDIPTNGAWADAPATWVDLNAPVKVSGADTNLDGAVNEDDEYLVYPVLDPRDPADPGTLDEPKVTGKMPGFSIAATAPVATDQQPAPMPVRWLYILQDGKIVAPTPVGTDGKTVEVAGADKDNPITGRIAFWTDDETAKVNVNTAAGSFARWNSDLVPGTWDIPRYKAWYERQLFSENQPVKGEYQRYPSHPATTDLFGILSGLGMTFTGYPYVVESYGASPKPAANVDGSNSTFFSILPRYMDGKSSRAGSKNTTTTSGGAPVINDGVPKRSRLYSSVSELLYDPLRNPSGLNRQQLESGKFFLTAQSRAPETTLFGTPRIAIWPIHKDNLATTRTAIDKLIAFCSTVGGKPYHVLRNNSRSPTSDYDDIERNKELFAYLKEVTSLEIPGFGGNFQTKYSHSNSSSNERDQILTMMLDYIRSTNVHDNNAVPAVPANFVRYSDNQSNIPGYSFQAQVTPLKIVEGGTTTRGLGRIQTISEIGMQVICTAEGSTTPHYNKLTGNDTVGYVPPETVSGAQVSPIKGSANDPAYASNLPASQYLRDNTGTNGKIIGWDSSTKTITEGTETALPSSGGPFPPNLTLTSNGLYPELVSGSYNPPLEALAPGEKKLQAMLLLELACPMMGYDSFQLNDATNRPAFKVKVEGLHGMRIGEGYPFPNRESTLTTADPNQNGNGFTDRMSRRNSTEGYGGVMGFRYLISDRDPRFNAWSGNKLGVTADQPYRYVSNPFKVTTATMKWGGEFKVELHVPAPGGTTEVYQTYNVDFPPAIDFPVPDLPKNGFSGNDGSGNPFVNNVPSDWWGFDFRIVRAGGAKSNGTASSPIHGPAAVIRADQAVSGTWTPASKRNVTIPTRANPGSSTGSDFVRTLVARDGDYRLVAAMDEIDADGSNDSPFAQSPGYHGTTKLSHIFKDQKAAHLVAGVDNGGKLVAGAPYSWYVVPKVPSEMDTEKMESWDWDSGLPEEADGAYSNKPDEGNSYVNGGASPYYNRETQQSNNISSYFTANRIVSSPVMFGSLPTGVVEGVSWRTLRFRPHHDRPAWADPAGPRDHLLLDLFWMPVVEPYAISEPFSTAGKVNLNYQIVPFTYIKRSSSIRSVLNSELIPRVPKAAAANLNGSDHNTYYKGKPGSTASTPSGAVSVARLTVNLDETLKQFEQEKFDQWEIFKSASEICDLYLTPQGYTLDEFRGNSGKNWYGDDFAMVGDNARERPYGNIYPRLTTKSNTFTVHYTVQSLKNVPINPSQWTEGRGGVTGEFRGSTTLERFINPANTQIPDYALLARNGTLDSVLESDPPQSLDKFYQWRIVSTRSFSP